MNNGQNPVHRARASLRPVQRRRFYKTVEAVSRPDGVEIHLDGHPLKTPKKKLVLLPNNELAEEILEEWIGQGPTLDSAKMPKTRLINVIIDELAERRPAVIDMLLAYCESDLLCYRAETPAELVARQRELWDPWIVRMAEGFGLRIAVGAGVMPLAQPAQNITIWREIWSQYPAMQLGATLAMTQLLGSAILALAVVRKWLDAAEAWRLAHVDEDWQIALWGIDKNAQERREMQWNEFIAACEVSERIGGPAGTQDPPAST